MRNATQEELESVNKYLDSISEETGIDFYDEYKYGKCECGAPLVPVKFIEEEIDNYDIPTGRIRRACSHLTCTSCFKNYVTDGEYLSGPWFRR